MSGMLYDEVDWKNKFKLLFKFENKSSAFFLNKLFLNSTFCSMMKCFRNNH